MSHLGIAHFPVLHRQFTSPKSKTSKALSAHEDLTHDSKDILIDRLNDLVLQLSRTNTLKDGAVSTIHSQVDQIEQLIRGHTPQQSPATFGTLTEDDDTFWGLATPTKNLKMRVPMSPKPLLGAFFHEPQMTELKASEVAQAAEDLASKLAVTVMELQKRKEESVQVHDLLVLRAERATERVVALEYQIAEMEDDLSANQSELNHLRIQVKAIELQCSEYIPRDSDPELTQAIRNWKGDWEEIDRRSKAKRHKYLVSSTQSSLDTSVSILDGT